MTSAWKGMCVEQLESSVRLTNSVLFIIILYDLFFLLISFFFVFNVCLSLHPGCLQIEISGIEPIVGTERVWNHKDRRTESQEYLALLIKIELTEIEMITKDLFV